MDITQGAPFESFGLSAATMRANQNKGYEVSTPVQAGCIPPMLAGKDVSAKAPTGTGKTMAFGIPIIERIDPENEAVQAVILAPTRELAMQISEEMREVAVCHEGVRLVCLYGGQPIGKQINALKRRPQIVVANKTDLLADPDQLETFRAHVQEAGYEFMAMSAATHQGTRELVQAIARRLAELPPVTVYEPEYVPRPPEVDTTAPLDIHRDDHTWLVEGPWLQRLMGNINFSDYESRMYFDKVLRQSGLFDQLEQMGIQDGDIVSMYDLEFEYQRCEPGHFMDVLSPHTGPAPDVRKHTVFVPWDTPPSPKPGLVPHRKICPAGEPFSHGGFFLRWKILRWEKKFRGREKAA